MTPGPVKPAAALAALVLLALSAFAAPALALAGELNWLGARLPNGPGEPWPFHVDGRKPAPAGVALAEVEAAFRGAFQRWQDVSCAYIEAGYQGLDPAPGSGEAGRGVAPGDGFNVMGVFIESALEDDELYDNALGGGAALAVALPLYYGGTIYGCDVAFNALDYRWSTGGEADRFDLATLALHEAGHCLGLDHAPGDPAASMTPFTAPGELRRELAPHDIDNLCQVYPQAGQVGSPCGSGCDPGLFCAGSGATAYCTRGCAPAEGGGCPVGFSCKTSEAVPGSDGACVFGGDAAVRVGAPCESGNDCGPGGLCLGRDGATGAWEGGYCTADCARDGCPANASCFDDPGAGGQRCLRDCRPGLGDCRSGYACEPVGASGGRCVPACLTDADCGGHTCRTCDGICLAPGNPYAAIGDGCALDSECPSGARCRLDLGGGTCSQSCNTGCTPCPAGSSCQPFGGERVCWRACEEGADCRAGFACAGERGEKSCQPGCTGDGQCPVGRRCEDGVCLPRLPADGGCSGCGSDGGETGGEDGGSGPAGTPPAGCGCTGAGVDGTGWAALAAVGLAVGSGRRRGGKQRR